MYLSCISFCFVILRLSDGSNIALFLQDWMKCLQTFCSNLRKTTVPTSNKRLRQVRL